MPREVSEKTQLRRERALVRELEARIEDLRRRHLQMTTERNEWKSRALTAEANVINLAAAVREDRTVGDRVTTLERRNIQVARTLNGLEERARRAQEPGWKGHDAPLVQVVSSLAAAFDDRPAPEAGQ